MKRDIYCELLAWKSSSRRKPLLLQGARQTGKTFILREFGCQEYENTVYCNFEEDSSLDQFFQNDLNPDRIVEELSVYLNTKLSPEDTLIIFDEIQASNQALNSLKYFAEKRKDIHIAAAGSLLGVKMSEPGSFPVGKVNFLNLYPMSFLEYLDAAGENKYREMIENIGALNSLPEPFHRHLIDRLRQYYFVGGMPEVVEHFNRSGNADEARIIQEEIIRSYILDFSKHAPPDDIQKLSLVWNSIPKHLSRENKKFIFSAVKKGARARSFESAISWLKDAGLIIMANAVVSNRYPLAHYADTDCFKVYVLDVGLLGAMSKTSVKLLVDGKRLFNEYEGAFVENYVAQQLVTAGQYPPLHYWRSRGGKAELDFLCDVDGEILPLEVKAGINPKSKSLTSYNKQYNPRILVRTSLLNAKKDGNTCNLPLYAVSQISSLLNH